MPTIAPPAPAPPASGGFGGNFDPFASSAAPAAPAPAASQGSFDPFASMGGGTESQQCFFWVASDILVMVTCRASEG